MIFCIENSSVHNYWTWQMGHWRGLAFEPSESNEPYKGKWQGSSNESIMTRFWQLDQDSLTSSWHLSYSLLLLTLLRCFNPKTITVETRIIPHCLNAVLTYGCRWVRSDFKHVWSFGPQVQALLPLLVRGTVKENLQVSHIRGNLELKVEVLPLGTNIRLGECVHVAQTEE